MCDPHRVPAEPQVHPRWRELNAFTHLEAGFEACIGGESGAGRRATDARGPLAGYRLVIKDNIDVAGMPTTCGTPSLRHHVPKSSAPAVANLQAAGAEIIGKANLHELAYGITSNNRAYGPVRNPYDLTRIAGGSSGGTAAAIAAGAVHAGLGTDTGGSARIPAALNGIVGFRPTVGRYRMEGVARISHTRDVIGPMGHSVTDVALLDTVLTGGHCARLEAAELRGLRIGLPMEHFQESLHPDVTLALAHVIAALRDAGVVLAAVDLEDIGALNAAVSFPLVLWETKTSLAAYLRASGLDLSLEQIHQAIASPDVKLIFAQVLQGAISDSAYLQALQEGRPRLQRLYEEYFARHRLEAVLFPTTPLPACPIDGCDETVSLNGATLPTFATYIRNTDPGSNAGIPGISLPAGFSLQSAPSPRHLPIGVEIDGPAGSDRRLLAIAAAVEEILNRRSSTT